MVKAKVLDVDAEKERISLGIKQLARAIPMGDETSTSAARRSPPGDRGVVGRPGGVVR